MSAYTGEGMQANCRVIWGPGDYDFDEQHEDDYEHFQCMIRRNEDLGTWALPLMMTWFHTELELAWRKLVDMVVVAANVKKGTRVGSEHGLTRVRT